MIPREVLDQQRLSGVEPPPQANAVGHGAVPVGIPEGQQVVPLALRNQLETIVGDLRIAYGRLGQLPPEAMEPDTFASLQRQYAMLMDIGGQLMGRLNGLGPALGEDLGLAKEINRLQEDTEMYVGAVESALAQMLGAANGGGPDAEGRHPGEAGYAGEAQWAVEVGPGAVVPANGGNGAAQLARGPWMKWGLVLGALIIIGGGTYWYYASRQRGVTAAL